MDNVRRVNQNYCREQSNSKSNIKIYRAAHKLLKKHWKLVVISTAFAVSFLAKGEEKDIYNEIPAGYTMDYEAFDPKNGDTLGKIAGDYITEGNNELVFKDKRILVEAIAEKNNIHPDSINTDDSLMIPVLRTDKEMQVIMEAENIGTYIYYDYIVQAGDSLTGIAEKFGTSVQGILSGNSHIHTNELLQCGIELKIGTHQKYIDEYEETRGKHF